MLTHIELKFAIAIFLIIGTSCELRQRETPEGPPEEKAPQAYFKAQVHQHPEPNHYTLELKWDQLTPAKTWYIYRATNGEQPTEIETLKGTTYAYADKEALPGESYEYTLKYTEGGDFLIKDKVSVKVPRDVVIDKHEDLNLYGHIDPALFKNTNRLFIKKGAGISMYNRPLTIDVNEIISEDGYIYHCYPRSGWSSNPRANTIIIRAKRARGFLDIKAFGTDGLNGRQSNRRSRLRDIEATPGGDSPKVYVEIKDAKDFDFDIERGVGHGGRNKTGSGRKKDGKLQPYCVRLGDQEFGDCRFFSKQGG